MEIFVIIIGVLVIAAGLYLGSTIGKKLSAEREVRRRQRYIESGYYNAQLNNEAMRRARERNGW